MSSPQSKSDIPDNKARKKDALALAELLYDIYKDKQNADNILKGQNNANEIKDT